MRESISIPLRKMKELFQALAQKVTRITPA